MSEFSNVISWTILSRGLSSHFQTDFFSRARLTLSILFVLRIENDFFLLHEKSWGVFDRSSSRCAFPLLWLFPRSRASESFIIFPSLFLCNDVLFFIMYFWYRCFRKKNVLTTPSRHRDSPVFFFLIPSIKNINPVRRFDNSGLIRPAIITRD